MELIGAALAMLALFPASHAAQGGQDASTIDVVRTDDDRFDRLTIPVSLGASGPYRFLLDTGAQNTVLSSALAESLSLPSGADATVLGVAGARTVRTAEIDSILLGRRSFSGLVAPLLDRKDIGADGILGLDSLQDQRVLLDFRRNLISIDDAASLGGDRGYEIVVRARRLSGQLIITNALVEGIRTRVIVDTGAEVSIGNPALQAAMARTRDRRQGVLDSVTGQSLTAEIGVARKLRVGDLSMANVTIAFADAPPFAALELDRQPALLLGMSELRKFRRVAIDFRSRKILFDLMPDKP